MHPRFVSKKAYRMDDFTFRNPGRVKEDEASFQRLQDDGAGSGKIKKHHQVIRERLNMSIDPGAFVSFSDNSIHNVDTGGSSSSLPFALDVPPPMFKVVSQEIYCTEDHCDPIHASRVQHAGPFYGAHPPARV